MYKTLLGAAFAAAFLTLQADDAAAPGPRLDQPAPAFRLNDDQGRIVEIGGENEEWTVLAFFPKAMTPG